MSYNGIGLPTPRGTGTSGYVQRNMSALNPTMQSRRGVYGGRQEMEGKNQHRESQFHRSNYVERKVDSAILEHEQKRAIEVECMVLRDELEEQEGIEAEEIERRVDELRSRLKARADDESETAAETGRGRGGRGQFKSHQVHEIVRAKEIENERFRLDVLSSSSRRAPRRSNSYTGGRGKSNRDRSLSPPTEDAFDNRYGRGNVRERSPSRDRNGHHRRRRESFNGGGRGGSGSPRERRSSWSSYRQHSRSRSPLRYDDKRSDTKHHESRSGRWRRGSIARESLSESPSPDSNRDEASSRGDRQSRRDSSTGGRDRPRSRSPHSSRQEGARDLRRRGSRYGPTDVELNYS